MNDDRNRVLPAPRPEVLGTPPAHHGAFDYAELERLGLRADEVLDFSVNSNPYGPSPAVKRALAGVSLDCYPDRESLALRRAISEHLGGVPLARILAGNGTAELLALTATAFLRLGDRVLIIAPAFGEYERVSAWMGARILTWRAQPEHGFAVDPEQISQRLRRERPRLLFVCNPNNPTGADVPLDAINAWASANPETLVVVDEAYLGFARGLPSAVSLGPDNLLVLRSMTKDYGLAGLRLGYAVGHETVIDALARVRPAWNVNAPAQAAGLAALSDQAHLAGTLSALEEAAAGLRAGLQGLGWNPLPSVVHFFLLPVGNGAAFRSKLLRYGIQVRDCASFGLPDCVRIAARRPEDNDRFLSALRQLSS